MKTYCVLLIIFTTFLWTGCKKKGCTDPNSTNYNEKAKKDDGSCVGNKSLTESLNSIIGVNWKRETDYVLYSFILNSDGTWTTDKDCNPKTEGTWEINYETSTLYHYFNGIQEEYEIIDPSSTVVKFRGGSGSNSDIAPINSLLVYQSQYTPSFIGVKNSYINAISQIVYLNGTVNSSVQIQNIPGRLCAEGYQDGELTPESLVGSYSWGGNTTLRLTGPGLIVGGGKIRYPIRAQNLQNQIFDCGYIIVEVE